jgi:branched-chain amino acid transport system permease protein
MTFVVTQAINGVVFGALLFLMAGGLTLILGTMRIVNLAHGSYYLLGGYIGLSIAKYTGHFSLACLGGVVAVGALGFATYKLILAREATREVMPQVLVTFGMLLVLSDVCRTVWGGVPLAIPKPEIFQSTLFLAGVPLPVYRLFVIASGAAAALFLWWFHERTTFGAVIRAGVDDEEMTEGIGINISAVKAFVFSLGAMLAGLAGVIGGPFIGLYPGLDLEIILLALIVVIIGGMGSLLGSLVGALVIGLVDALGKSLIPEFSMFLLFASMLLVLVAKPGGLFGTR